MAFGVTLVVRGLVGGVTYTGQEDGGSFTSPQKLVTTLKSQGVECGSPNCYTTSSEAVYEVASGPACSIPMSAGL